MTCRAIRQGDQMHCGACGLQWDVDEASECTRDHDADKAGWTPKILGGRDRAMMDPGFDDQDDGWRPYAGEWPDESFLSGGPAMEPRE